MTVSELRSLLATMPDDAVVYLTGKADYWGTVPLLSVATVDHVATVESGYHDGPVISDDDEAEPTAAVLTARTP